MPSMHKKKLMAEIIKKQLSRGVDGKHKSLQSLREKENKILKEYHSILKTMEQLEIELNGYGLREKMIDERVEREINALDAIKDLEKYIVRSNGVEGHTKAIKINGIYVGKFKILLRYQEDFEDGYDDTRDVVKITNKNRRIKGFSAYYDHPHISDGKPCLGNIRSDLIKLINKHEYAAAMQICVSFLKSVPRGGGIYLDLSRWDKKRVN